MRLIKIIYRKAFGVFYEKIIETKDETIEHLEELLLKRNKMLFGRKSEKSKYLQCDGQESFEGVFNEAEMLSDETAEEPTEETIVVKRKSQKTGEHRGKNKLREDLPKEKIVSKLPENKCNCAVCGSKLKVIKEEFSFQLYREGCSRKRGGYDNYRDS